LVKKSEDKTMARGTHRESGAQPTPLEEAHGATGPGTRPRDVSTPSGHSPEGVDWGGAGETYQSSTRPTGNKQLSEPSDTEDTSDDNHTNRKSGAQPMPPKGTLGANGPDAQASDVSAPQGDDPERFDWQVDLRDNTYKYERLVEPVGSAEQAGGRNSPFRTTATLNLQPMRLLTCWSDELIGSGGAFDRGRPAIREDTQYLGPADSPVSHNNLWDWAVTPPTGNTASSVYDGGRERLPETPQNGTEERSCVTQP